MNMAYQPRPIPTDQVTLPDSLQAITEQLAESTHDIWARQRLAEGWCYGLKRMMARSSTPAWFLMAICPTPKRSTTGRRPWRRSRLSWRWATESILGRATRAPKCPVSIRTTDLLITCASWETAI